MSRPFRYYVRVRYQDCDSQHVVFNARYGDYIDLAVTEFLRATMPGRDPMDGSFEIQVKKQVIEWNGPARFNDVLEIETALVRAGTSSFDLRFDIRRPGEEAPIVVAVTTYVHVLLLEDRWRSAPLPEEPKAALVAGARGVIVDHAGHYPIRLP
jgi:acyl-CoA thioester hydrolase